MPDGFCETNINNGRLAGKKLKRNNYYSGKKMDVDDFNVEQNYVIDKVRTLSAQTNGSGVIDGLKIDSISGKKVTLNAGAAVDACGNLLLLYKQRVFELDQAVKADDYIYLKYAESGSDKVPRQNSVDCGDECCYDRIEEDVQIVLGSELLTPNPAKICDGLKGKSSAVKAILKEPLVLLGIYRSNGGIDYSGVVYLHKNSELSKRLCEISQKYVSSVNGVSGDVSAVVSVNNAKPDGNGHLSLEGGNNIAVESSGNTVTISTKSGFYNQHYISLNEGAATSIEHNCGRYPLVDIYRQVQRQAQVSLDRYEAISRAEISRMAKDTMQDVEGVVKMLDAKTFAEYTREYNSQNDSQQKTLSQKSGKNTDQALLMFDVAVYSSKIHKMSHLPISSVKDDIYIKPRYNYQKIVGAEDPNMNVTVTHTSNNSVQIKNNGSEKIALLVVLST